MIRDVGGRFRSFRTAEDYARLIQSEMASLSPEEKVAAQMILEDLLNSGQSPLLEEATQRMYRTKPVSMKEFLDDPYFMGPVSKTFYPKMKEQLIEVFSGGYNIAFWGGALGVAKTTAGVIAIMRMAYELSCLWNPHETYGISKSDTISLPCISVTEDIAERNIVDKLRAFISESPYFQKEFAPIKDTQLGGILFPHRILIPPGASTEAGVLGTNAIGCFIDESNFFRKRARSLDEQQNKSNIQKIYESMKRRIESRFLSKGKLPGIIFVASSKTSVDSFTEREVRASTDRPDVFVAENAVWEMHPESRYGKARFRVAVGNETLNSRILAEGEDDPEGMVVLQVPMEFYESFERDLDQAIRDFGGVATVSITPFIARRDKIQSAIDPTRRHPFSSEVWDMSMPGRINWDLLCNRTKDGAFVPKLNPQAPRHIHLDLSKNTDATGFSVCHVAGYVPVKRPGHADIEMAPMIVVDFMLKMRAAKGGEIVYSEVRNLIYEFSRHGFFIKLVSADQFQSLSILQTLQSQGYKTKVVSVEPPGGPYEALKLALYEDRFRMYNYPPVTKELRGLQKNWKTGKVDHPEDGEKDVSDSLAANVATLALAQMGVTDQIILTSGSHDEAPDDSTWVLDDPRTVVIEPDLGSAEPGKEWREGAKQSGTWQNNFSLPFEVG